MNANPDRNLAVRAFWEQEPCGTNMRVTGEAEPLRRWSATAISRSR
jgi:hypothetical protein